MTLSVGYQRRRATLGTAWEGGVVTILLTVGGIAIVLLFLWAIGNLRLF